MKTFKTLLLTIAALLCSISASAHDFEVDGIYYNIISEEDMTVEVTYKGINNFDYANEYIGEVIIPESINYNGSTYSVTSIGRQAFYECSELTKVTIPRSVTSIEGDAFSGCSNLTNITIPTSVTNIGGYAFHGCSSLTSITIPYSVKTIESSTFRSCTNLISVTIPNSVTLIESAAFSGCTNLKNVTIPNSVKRIENTTFFGCTSLTNVTIPNSVTSIGRYAFSSCSNLTNINIPNSVTSIEGYAFSGCSNLTNVNIPNSVTSIGEYVFKNCPSLTSIIIPNSVTSIGEGLFSGQSGLTNIVVDGGNEYFDSRESCNAIIKTKSNTLIAGCLATVIPNTVTTIGYGVFRECSNLTCITIPNSVTSIEGGAFYECKNLKTIINFSALSLTKYSSANGSVAYYADKIINADEQVGDFYFRTQDGIHYLSGYVGTDSKITLPENYKGGNYEIEERAFYNCNNLTNVIIPNSVTSIGRSAFLDCINLMSVTIPYSVTNIGDWAFISCKNLKTVINFSTLSLKKGHPSNGYVAYYADRIINVDEQVGDFYFRTQDGVHYLSGYVGTDSEIALPEKYNGDNYEIEERAFFGCSNLTTIRIPYSVTNIGNEAFSGCSGLMSIIVDKNNRIYDSRDNCNAIIKTSSNTLIVGCQSTVIPNSVTSIGAGAFSGCSNLTSITIPDSVTNIGSNAFSGCSNIIQLICTATTPPYCNLQALDGINKDICTLKVLKNCKKAYQSAYQWQDFLMIEDYVIKFSLVWIIDDKVVQADSITYGETIEIMEFPVKEGYTFSGWSEVPKTMPLYDVTVKGTFTINKYLVTFKIGDEVIATDSLEYGAAIVAPKVPEKEGYSFNGWGEIVATVPANDVTIEGSYSVNSYLLTYMVDGKTVQADSVTYGTQLTLPDEPAKEGYTFSGWSEIPETMPAQDITVTGTFTANVYVITFLIGNEVYAVNEIRFGDAITLPEPPTKEGYIFSGWSEIPETMPAHDVTVSGNFEVTGIEEVTAEEFVDVYTLQGVKVKHQLSVKELAKELPRGIYIVGGKKVVIK